MYGEIVAFYEIAVLFLRMEAFHRAGGASPSPTAKRLRFIAFYQPLCHWMAMTMPSFASALKSNPLCSPMDS